MPRVGVLAIAPTPAERRQPAKGLIAQLYPPAAELASDPCTSPPKRAALCRVFSACWPKTSREREVRERIGHHLLELLSADYYASFVWDTPSRSFGSGVWLNMSPDNLASYDAYFQYNDPITLKLQARREPTLVTQIMPQRELMRTEFFNDFLARDGLHWGVNVYSYAGQRNIGDLRIWRGRHRENFDLRTLELLRLVEPAFTGALMRAGGTPRRRSRIRPARRGCRNANSRWR